MAKKTYSNNVEDKTFDFKVVYEGKVPFELFDEQYLNVDLAKSTNKEMAEKVIEYIEEFGDVSVGIWDTGIGDRLNVTSLEVVVTGDPQINTRSK